MYISEVIKPSIFGKSNNSELPIVLRMAQKLPDGSLPAASRTALYVSNIPTFPCYFTWNKRAKFGNRKPIKTEGVKATRKYD